MRLQLSDRGWHTDLFVELDRMFKPAKNIDKFERYDHMLSGWLFHKDRYSKYLPDPPMVVFICRDQSNAKEFCRAADPVVTAAQAYGGEYPAEWPYPARERMFFVAERDVHEGRFVGYVLPTLPPEVRVQQADGDAKARGCHPRLRPVPPDGDRVGAFGLGFRPRCARETEGPHSAGAVAWTGPSLVGLKPRIEAA